MDSKRIRLNENGTSFLKIPPDCICNIFQYLREHERWRTLGLVNQTMRMMLTKAVGVFYKIQDFTLAINYNEKKLNRWSSINFQNVKKCFIWNCTKNLWNEEEKENFPIEFNLETVLEFMKAMPQLELLTFVRCRFSTVMDRDKLLQILMKYVKPEGHPFESSKLIGFLIGELKLGDVMDSFLKLKRRMHNLVIVYTHELSNDQVKNVDLNEIIQVSFYGQLFLGFQKLNPELNVYFEHAQASVCYSCGYINEYEDPTRDILRLYKVKKLINQFIDHGKQKFQMFSCDLCHRTFCQHCVQYTPPNYLPMDQRNPPVTEKKKSIMRSCVNDKKHFNCLKYCGHVGDNKDSDDPRRLCYLCISEKKEKQCSVCKLKPAKGAKEFQCATCSNIVYDLLDRGHFTMREVLESRYNYCAGRCASCKDIMCFKCLGYCCPHCKLLCCLNCEKKNQYCCIDGFVSQNMKKL